MKCSSVGALRHAAWLIRTMAQELDEEELDNLQPYAAAFTLEEFAGNIERVHRGEATLQELAECYCMLPSEVQR